MKEPEWVMIFSTSLEHEAIMLRGYLNDHDVSCVLMNKKDSTYLIGEVEIYVAAEDALRAKQLINKRK